ncbi:uncharacterized protein [Watersipora subatra]|uniref:uncharacterized protein n=1 Tax=Watersipora subatra TaxID=2589382 RepID=UPI00355AE0F5
MVAEEDLEVDEEMDSEAGLEVAWEIVSGVDLEEIQWDSATIGEIRMVVQRCFKQNQEDMLMDKECSNLATRNLHRLCLGMERKTATGFNTASVSSINNHLNSVPYINI